ncbi:PREDICTED: gastrula zinc finger protein XlCGF8.2DB-like [Cyprinodon variegatus]|uniref:gastrula zinc finger protein XlCGF8.2DB-like n=1 Tax=Cyprinodon variegatus TaxID=28743 RepID=UPI0007425D9A|nr:PREDICTED: gastrula zinc finger protein XlCGF8.2DB-like [Cyprinodon variegatus]
MTDGEDVRGRRCAEDVEQLSLIYMKDKRSARHTRKPVVKLHRIAHHQLHSKNSNQQPQQTGDQQKNCSLVAEKKRLRNGKEDQLVVKQDGHQRLPSIGRNPSEHQVRDDKESGRTDQTQQSDGGAPTDQNPLKGKSLINHQNDSNAGENVFLCKSCAKDSAPVTPADSKAPYCCSKCQRNFPSTGEPASSPNADEKPFSCSECEKSFETEEALTQHMKEYSEVKDVFCPECGNNFKTKHWLMAHRRLYAKTRPNYQCICGQSFREEDDLLRHRKSYHSEKAYVCDYCKMSFSQRSSLQIHTQMHRYLHMTKTKPTKRFQCDLCKKSYCFKKKLESHMMGHVKKLHSREMMGKIQK